ncbi:MAG: Arc family DNA-binding protein [Gemmatimonadota bacterium]|nr:Arc family DNA-binding protein [Gemmatimonadota bacterium]
MPDLALRGIPEELHRELKASARRNHRSLNGEILARLAASVRTAPVEAAVLLERIRRRNRGPRAGRPRHGHPGPSAGRGAAAVERRRVSSPEAEAGGRRMNGAPP